MKNWPAALRRQFPKNTSLDPKVLAAHAGDAWFAQATPGAVFFANSAESVSRLLQWANRHRISVTARGAGRGYVGGCVPSKQGIALSLARMNRILEINPEDGVAVVQPGVITVELQEAARKLGLFYPPDPASLKKCSLGGNVATNAGGPRCLKYGVTRNYILGLQVALADGTLVRVGSRTIKNKTGFDLVGPFVGSEGLLGIVTEITTRLIPHPQSRAVVSASFSDARKAAATVQSILRHGFLPAALEVADRFTLESARKHLGSDIIPRGRAHLLVEIDGSRKSVAADLPSLKKLIRAEGAITLAEARTEAACEKLWQLRREFSASLKATGLTKLNEDITVPRGKLVELFHFAEKLQKKNGLPVACFGHAGDGNIHVNIMADLKQPGAQKKVDAALDELFRQVIAWGGAITGEHGIGLAKKRWWPQAASPELRALHRTVKKALDPKNILNPGKFV